MVKAILSGGPADKREMELENASPDLVIPEIGDQVATFDPHCIGPPTRTIVRHIYRASFWSNGVVYYRYVAREEFLMDDEPW